MILVLGNLDDIIRRSDCFSDCMVNCMMKVMLIILSMVFELLQLV